MCGAGFAGHEKRMGGRIVRSICLRLRAVCVNWELQQRLRCARWRTVWMQRCDRWRTEQTQRCDRWEQEQKDQCEDWGWFSWICVLWVTITTWVCRLWVTVITTVCDLWVTVTSTICDLWTWLATLVCDLWTFFTTLVCRLWAFVFETICSIFCIFQRLLAPNEYSFPKAECIYGWMAAFRIDEDARRCHLQVTLRIRLVAEEGVSQADLAACRARWEPAIEQAWSRRFGIVLQNGNCRCRDYSLDVNVQFVEAGAHHTVTVHAGSGRADMNNWYVASTGGTAAHEAGHMFGNPDEYADKNCPSRVVTADGSIMQSSQTGSVKERHYSVFAGWISKRTCCTYAVGGAQG